MLKRMSLKSKLTHDKRRLKFLGYTGAAVDVSDYGFDAPLIYDLSALQIKNQKLPVKFNHKEDVGTTEKVEKHPTRGVRGEGEFSDTPIAKKIQNNADRGLPYEGSMGLDVESATFTRYSNGVTVNGRHFPGKHYVARGVIMDEITITRSGRDSDTKVHVLSKMELSNIKEAQVPKKVIKKPIKKVVNRKPTHSSNDDHEERRPRRKLQRVQNSAPKVTLGQAFRLKDLYPDFGEMIGESVDAGWSFRRLENALKFKTMELRLPVPPSLPGEDDVDDLEARLLAVICKDPEKCLEKQYGEETRDRILNMGQLSIKEFMVIGAQRMGRNFSGHSDAEQLIDFIGNANLGRMNNSMGFSSFNMPNLFKRTTEFVVEEAWKIEDFFAPGMCDSVSMSNFKTTERFRPSGGAIWEGLDANGRIKHTSFGKEQRYTTDLDTKAQMVMFNRETIENDDFGVIKDLIQLMMEGAEIIPDYKLIQRIYQPLGTFFVNDENHFYLALNEENLTYVFEKMRQMTISKGRVSWNQLVSDEWWLVIPNNLTMEKIAFDLVEQNRIVSNSAVTGQVGDKNFWFNRLRVKTFNQLSNTTFHDDADTDNWLLWPKSKRYAPFSLSYLRGRKRPIMKTFDAPPDMLGFGIAGVFDVECNDRERTAIARCTPTTTTS